MWAVRRAAAVFLGAVTVLTGCTGESTMADPTAVSGTVDDATAWDLTEPPTRYDVGMRAGQSDAVYRTEQPRTVSFTLPEDVELELTTTLVNFSSVGRVDSETAAPVRADATTPVVDLAVAYEWLADGLRALGAPTRPAEVWLRAAEGAEGVAAVTSEQVRRTVGYLTVSVTGRYDPATEHACVGWIFSWR